MEVFFNYQKRFENVDVTVVYKKQNYKQVVTNIIRPKHLDGENIEYVLLFHDNDDGRHILYFKTNYGRKSSDKHVHIRNTLYKQFKLPLQPNFFY